jgi:hypothetical protein
VANHKPPIRLLRIREELMRTVRDLQRVTHAEPLVLPQVIFSIFAWQQVEVLDGCATSSA